MDACTSTKAESWASRCDIIIKRLALITGTQTEEATGRAVVWKFVHIAFVFCDCGFKSPQSLFVEYVIRMLRNTVYLRKLHSRDLLGLLICCENSLGSIYIANAPPA